MGCIKDPSFAIILNGCPSERFKASRGIRQGDPLSHFVFILIGEVFTTLIDNIHLRGVYEGFILSSSNIDVSILQFADDTLLFCQYNDLFLSNLKETVELFNGSPD